MLYIQGMQGIFKVEEMKKCIFPLHSLEFHFALGICGHHLVVATMHI